MINFSLKLMYFADTNEWRLYDDQGCYWTAKSIDEIPQTIKTVLWLQSKFFRKMSEMPDVEP